MANGPENPRHAAAEIEKTAKTGSSSTLFSASLRLCVGALGAGLILSLVLVLPAAAETVHMKDGRTFVGKVTKLEGKYKVDTAMGALELDVAAVAYVDDADVRAPAPAPAPAVVEGAVPKLDVACRWDPEAATLPEPHLFMAARQAELLGADPGADNYRKQASQWRTYARDGRRKWAAEWLTPEEQARHRKEFQDQLREASSLIRTSAYTRDAVATQQKVEQGKQKLMAAVNLWPDPVMAQFLSALADLHLDRPILAETKFRLCIEAEPLVAAFHQGKGVSALRLKQPMRGIESVYLAARLRDDAYEAIQALEQALREAPLAQAASPLVVESRRLVESYEKPRYARTPAPDSINWLLPGRPWAIRGELPAAPRFERILCRQTLGVPVLAEGGLAVDQEVLAKADQVYVQLAPGDLVRCDVPRGGLGLGLGSSREPGPPLALLTVPLVDFTPQDLVAAPKPATEQTVAVRAVNAWRQMGTELRLGEAKVLAADKDGLKLERPALPGEAMSVVLVGDRIAGLLTARTDVLAEDSGQSRFIPAAQIAAWAKQRRSTSTRPSYTGSSSGATLKEGLPRRAAVGDYFQVFVLQAAAPAAK